MIDGGGEILEPVVDERPPQPPRPSSTPITRHYQTQQQQTQTQQQQTQTQQQQTQPPLAFGPILSIQPSRSLNMDPGVQPGRQLSLDPFPTRPFAYFQAFDDIVEQNASLNWRDNGMEVRSSGASWRDSGVDPTVLSGAEDSSQNASLAQRN